MSIVTRPSLTRARILRCETSARVRLANAISASIGTHSSTAAGPSSSPVASFSTQTPLVRTARIVTRCRSRHQQHRALPPSCTNPRVGFSASLPGSSLGAQGQIGFALDRPPISGHANALTGGGSVVQIRRHMGGSHGHGGHHHHHHHDNTYLTSKNRSDPGVRITRIGLYVNLGMAVAKGLGGYVFNSKALMADAAHALTDLVSDLATLATISYSLRPASTRFPLGYGKIESLGALGVSGLLLSGGIAIGLHALMALSQQLAPDMAHMLSQLGIFEHLHSHSHSHGHEHGHDMGPSLNAAWLAAGSIVIKESLYRATMKVAKQKRSSVLASNAYHHRVDSLTAFVALLTICASHVFEHAQWLDPVGGLIIAGMVVQAGWINTHSALLELADVTVDAEIRDQIVSEARKALAEQLNGAMGEEARVRGVQGIKSGQNLLIEVDVGVPQTWTLTDMNAAETTLRERIAAGVRGVRRVTVHFSNVESSNESFGDQFIAQSRSDDPEAHSHGHVGKDHDHSSSGHIDANGGTSSSAAPPMPRLRK